VDAFKRSLILLLALAVGALAAGCGGGASGGKTLTLGSIGWNENIAVSTLTKVVMQDDLGYDEVQIKGPLELGPLFDGVASGDLQAFQDVWLPNHEQYLNEPQVKNNVEVLDPWYEGATAYGIAVPDYMKNIQSLADLNHAGTDEITGIEPSAAFMPVIHDKVIPGYHLDMKLVESSTAAMLSELDRKYETREPIVFLAWSPHWMNQEYDFRYLSDPKNAMGGVDDPQRLHSVTRKGLAEDEPAAYALINAMRLNEGEVGSLELAINKADDPVTGVRQWLQERKNRELLRPWIEAAKNAQEG
jgi:glycine betaine/proline transport system substrate-binding protein